MTDLKLSYCPQRMNWILQCIWFVLAFIYFALASSVAGVISCYKSSLGAVVGDLFHSILTPGHLTAELP